MEGEAVCCLIKAAFNPNVPNELPALRLRVCSELCLSPSKLHR